MRIVTFTLLVLVAVACIAPAHTAPHHSRAPSSIEAEPVSAAAAPALATLDIPAVIETPQDLVDKRNYFVQTTTSEAPEATYPAVFWPKRKRDRKDITKTDLAKSIDTTGVLDVVARRADVIGPSLSKTMTKSKPKPKPGSKTETKKKQPPVKPTSAPTRPPRPNLPPLASTPSSAPSPTSSSAPDPSPSSTETSPPTKPLTKLAMVSNNAPKPDKCHSATLTWKVFIDNSEKNGLRWRHEVSYIIAQGSSDSLTFIGGKVLQDEKTKITSESNDQSTHFSADGSFGAMITPVGHGTGIVWFWRGLTRQFSKPNAIVPYSGDDMKYGYEYWDCVPGTW
ncbi:hypothetical protein BGZ91_001749 [Linnemannia elongata]|nr:hypothetical protein BGZ91_001749 [Linnemannia elongata]